MTYPPQEDIHLNALLSIQSPNRVWYNMTSFNASIFSPTGNQFDLLNSEMLSKITLEEKDSYK
jgi:hypothetical protein